MFLARLGKKRLSPGGRAATEWLLAQSALDANSIVLEIACNMGTTAIDIARRFQCPVIGIDTDTQALRCAQENIAAHGLSHLVTLQLADARQLPFGDNSFDVVINEAMLTLYPDSAKAQLIQEYLRVLKPGGRLLTHDMALKTTLARCEPLHQAVHVNAQPMLKEAWAALFRRAGFRQVCAKSGSMTLLSLRGLLYDEGPGGTLKIIHNGLKKENRQQFLHMCYRFRRQRHQLNYIAVASVK